MAAIMKAIGSPLFKNISLKTGSYRSVSFKLTKVKYAETVSCLPETQVTQISNGVRVASFQKDSPTAAVGLWINSGSRYETHETNGVANFHERLLLKGNSVKAGQDIENQINNMGAKFYADTGRERTSLSAECLSSDVPNVVEILGNAVKNTDFDNSQIEIERKAILSELKEIETHDLKQVTLDHLHTVGFQGTPLGMTVYGPTENIKNISKSDIVNYVKSNIVGPRVVLAGSGNISHDELVKLAEKHLGSLQKDDSSSSLKACRFTGSDIRDRDDWLPFAHVAIAVDTCGASSDDVLPLTLAKTHIGCWDKTCLSSSTTANLLIQNIYKEPTCHSFESFHQLYHDIGLWGCYFVAGKMVLDDFTYNLQNEWKRLCIDVTESALNLAKKKQIMEQLNILNNNALNCNDIGNQVLDLGKHTSFRELEEKINSVSLNRFREVCSKYIYDRCPVVSAVGPIESLTDYVRIRGDMYLLRY